MRFFLFVCLLAINCSAVAQTVDREFCEGDYGNDDRDFEEFKKLYSEDNKIQACLQGGFLKRFCSIHQMNKQIKYIDSICHN